MPKKVCDFFIPFPPTRTATHVLCLHSDLPSTSILPEAVTDEDVATVVARHTGVPVSRLLMGEREKLLHMEHALTKRVVGMCVPLTPALLQLALPVPLPCLSCACPCTA